MSLAKIEIWDSCKDSAIAITFDDFYIESWKMIASYANSKNIKLTFFVNTYKFQDFPRKENLVKPVPLNKDDIQFLKQIVKEGHEVGCHTTRHFNLHTLNNEEIEQDILEWKQTMEKNKIIKKNQDLTFSFPFGNKPKNLDIIKKYFITARGYGGGLNKVIPKDLYKLKTINIGKRTKLFKLNSFIEDALQNNNFIIEAGHGLNKEGWSPINQNILFNHFDFIYLRQNEIWCETYTNIVKYIIQRNSIELVQSHLDSQGLIILEFKQTKELNIKELIPLTISLEIPEDKKIKNIIQKKKEIIIEQTNTGKIYIKTSNFNDHIYIQLV